jgi:hypothetical protein
MKTTKRVLLGAAAMLALSNANYAQVTFTKIPVDTGYNYAGASWLDFDNDGYLDLLVANGVATSTGDYNVLYRNNGNGTFTKITSGVVASDVGYSLSVACGDYDNDGLPDLFFGGAFGPTPTVTSLFYHNTGGGNFEPITTGNLVNTMGNFIASWVDYDNDGFLDIFLANTGGPNYLFRNQGDGTFAAVTPAIPAHSSGRNLANGATWADYDNDGFPDVFIFGGAGHNLLFHNDHNGKFTQVHGAPFDTDLGPSAAAAWVDYDNDGFLDLFVTTGNFDTVQRQNYLYHNNGNGTFTKITTGAIATDTSSSIVAAWEDFDNDGNLDLFVSQNTGTSGPARQNILYHNNGDGTFTSLTNTPLTADSGYFAGIAWGDYDNDGFPDLFVAAGQPSFIYHNEGNTNNWITFKLVGTVSNRSAIGAKVRVKATIRGKTYWQMRHISNGDGLGCNSLNAHFGLGDATVAETVRIEWPSGAVQEFQRVAAKQFLTVTEPSRLAISATNGRPQMILKGGRNLQYDIQAGTDLVHWSLLATTTITNLDGTIVFTDTNAPVSNRRFYRAALH